MSKFVWKATIDLTRLYPTGATIVPMPFGSRVVAARSFGDPSRIDVWFEFFHVPSPTDLNQQPSPFAQKIYVFGTGHPIASNLSYRATAFADPFVWHIYQEGRA